jgi:hypothetical protein
VRPTTLWPGERAEEKWKTLPQARPVSEIMGLIRHGELIPPDHLIISRWHSRDFRAYPDTLESWKPWKDYVVETLGK